MGSADELVAWVKENPGRAVTVLWGINFFLNITDLVTFRGQSALSLVLAVASVVLLVRHDKE